MKKSLVFGVFAFCIALFLISLVPAPNNDENTSLLGGACSYDKYLGECKIISISKTEASKQQKSNAGYEGFEVMFKFIPKSNVSNISNYTLNKEYLFQLANSWYPGPEYLEKYNIEEEHIFNCDLMLITKGTCSPVGFEFETINLIDYFETNNSPCTDSDGGKNYFVEGTITINNQIIGTDSCLNSTERTLMEYYCHNNKHNYIFYNCPNKCENGACKQKEDSDENETEDDNKICCMIVKTEDDNKTEIEYDFKDTKDCSKNETKKTREIVNNSLCKVKEKHEFKEKNKLKFEGRTGIDCPEECTCTGVVMKCQLASGREMTIFAGKSGNVIFQIKGVNMTTNVTLYKENETIYGNFSNETKEIKILPDQVKERLREKLKSEIEEESDIELKDDGNYKMEVKKKAKLFWIFSVKEKVKAEIDSENGDTKTNSPWWGFLARDSKS